MTTRFSSGDAALYGFRFFKLAPWAVVGVLLLFGFQSVLSFWPQFLGFTGTELAFLKSRTATDSMFWIVLAFIVLFVLTYASSFAIQGAILRPLTGRLSEGWVFGLKLGMDELRLFLLTLLFVAGFSVLYLTLFVITIILGFSTRMLADSLGAPVIFGLPMIVAGIADLCVVIYLAVRLSPAFAATVAEKRIVITDAWRISEGRFWALLGAYVLAFFVSLVPLLCIWACLIMLGIAVGPAVGLEAIHLADSGMPALIAASLIAATILAMLYLVAYLPLMGVGAYMYLFWVGSRPPETGASDPVPASG